MADATANANTESTHATSAASFGIRVFLIMGGWTTLHLAVVASLAHPLVLGGWWTFLALYVALLGSLAVLIRSFREEAYPGKWRRLLVMRPFWYAQIVLFPASLTGAAVWLVGLPFGRGAAWGGAAVLTAAAVMATVAIAGWFGSRALVVRRLKYAYADLPAAFDGMTIAQLSDLHVGPHTSRRFMRRIAQAVEAAKPDLIAYTGDQVDDYDVDVRYFNEHFGHLHAPLGVFAIAGNHDVYAGWPGVRDGMRSAGMLVLVNDAVPVRKGSDEIWIIGTGDPAGRQSFGPSTPEVAPDLPRSLANVPPGAFAIALAHNPALWPPLAQAGVRLTLSGHTHHGQLSLPALKWSLASPFLELAMGSYERGASRLYINPGTNFWALPLRLGAWPEVTLVTLTRS